MRGTRASLFVFRTPAISNSKHSRAEPVHGSPGTRGPTMIIALRSSTTWKIPVTPGSDVKNRSHRVPIKCDRSACSGTRSSTCASSTCIICELVSPLIAWSTRNTASILCAPLVISDVRTLPTVHVSQLATQAADATARMSFMPRLGPRCPIPSLGRKAATNIRSLKNQPVVFVMFSLDVVFTLIERLTSDSERRRTRAIRVIEVCVPRPAPLAGGFTGVSWCRSRLPSSGRSPPPRDRSARG